MRRIVRRRSDTLVYIAVEQRNKIWANLGKEKFALSTKGVLIVCAHLKSIKLYTALFLRNKRKLQFLRHDNTGSRVMERRREKNSCSEFYVLAHCGELYTSDAVTVLRNRNQRSRSR